MIAKKNRKSISPTFERGRVTDKTPAFSPSFDPGERQCPVWQIRLLELDGPFSWHPITRSLLVDEILPKLQSFERMTWEEILGRKNHSVRVADLCRDAQKRLEHLRLDDVEELVSLRLDGKERVWGIRRKASMLLLWWDPNHEVCPSEKKHT